MEPSGALQALLSQGAARIPISQRIPKGIEQPLLCWNGAHLINKSICKRIVTYCQTHNHSLDPQGKKE